MANWKKTSRDLLPWVLGLALLVCILALIPVAYRSTVGFLEGFNQFTDGFGEWVRTQNTSDRFWTNDFPYYFWTRMVPGSVVLFLAVSASYHLLLYIGKFLFRKPQIKKAKKD